MKASLWIVLMGCFIFSVNVAARSLYAGWSVGGSADGYGTILRTANSGATWMRQGAPGVIANVNLNGVVAVDPYTAWVVGDSDGSRASIYHTIDGGITWGSIGPAEAAGINLGKVHTMDGRRVWAVGKNAILYTDDGGVTWTNQLPTGYENIGLQGVYTPDGINVWVTGEHKDGYAVILKSSNGGQTWVRQTNGDVTQANHILGVSAIDANTAWAVGGANDFSYIILHTTDGGLNWTRQTFDFGGVGDANEIDALTDQLIWGAFDHGVFWSTDGGLHGDYSGNHGHVTAIATMGISAVSEQESWSSVTTRGPGGVTGAIWHTSDGGQTWERQGPENISGLWTISMSNIPLSPRKVPALGVLSLFALGGLLLLAAVRKHRYSYRSSPIN